jgi:hypothetical protein
MSIYADTSVFISYYINVIGCRSLDILHVTLAKKLAVTKFPTFDVRQKALANALGLTVKP